MGCKREKNNHDLPDDDHGPYNASLALDWIHRTVLYVVKTLQSFQWYVTWSYRLLTAWRRWGHTRLHYTFFRGVRLSEWVSWTDVIASSWSVSQSVSQWWGQCCLSSHSVSIRVMRKGLKRGIRSLFMYTLMTTTARYVLYPGEKKGRFSSKWDGRPWIHVPRPIQCAYVPDQYMVM